MHPTGTVTLDIMLQPQSPRLERTLLQHELGWINTLLHATLPYFQSVAMRGVCCSMTIPKLACNSASWVLLHSSMGSLWDMQVLKSGCTFMVHGS